MKERPILFRTQMVQAILEDRKTMTRRAVKMPPRKFLNTEWDGISESFMGESGREYVCPYGKPGDVLWIREMHYRYGKWAKNGTTKTGKQKWRFLPDSAFSEVRFFDNPPAKIEKNTYRKTGWYKRSSLFMPREACRLRLLIKSIRVERLQDITDKDAIAEGIEIQTMHKKTEKMKFHFLWDIISGPES